VEGRLGTLETYVEKNHKELIELIQTLADHVTVLSDRVMPPGKNEEQPKVTKAKFRYDGLEIPYFESSSTHKRNKNLMDDEGFQASNKEDLLFRVISKGDTTKENPSRSENIMGSYGADFRLRKLKMPIFEREDAYGWIYRMERYFDIQGIEDIDQLKVTVLCMEGDALSWYRWSEHRSPFRQLVGISEEVLEGTFIKGLKPDLRSVVRVMQPEGLNHAMKLAIYLGENKNYDMLTRRGGSNRSTGPTSTSSYTRNSGTGSTRTLVSTIPADHKNGSGSLVRPGPFKRLIEAEFTEKRSKVLLVGDDEEFVKEETNGSDTSHVHLDSVEVSLNSVIGFTSPRTMKLRGNISGIDIVIIEDFFPLPLGSTDAILGIKWLETLGDMSVNWKTLTMSFGEGENRVTIRGDPGLSHTLISLKSIAQVLQRDSEAFLVEMNTMEQLPEMDNKLNSIEQEIVSEFEDVFLLPFGLPPHRNHEYSIILKEGAGTISVRPYRYPQVQKDKIERLVREMLEAGVIQPSSSPFSSPVLLVKKKNGSWLFCMDYRALNKATVLDKFPIPVINELLDELHGATTMREHRQHLKIVFNCLREQKCSLAQEQIEYLGHIVSSKGVSADPSKISAIVWKDSIEFIVETDASGYGIGAVLLQDGRPIAFFSQILGARARLKSVYERELMVIVLAIQKWQPYLLGRHFIVRTDQRSLKFLLEQRMVTEEYQRWLSKLSGYDFEIQYLPGRENRVADALSRRMEEVTCNAISFTNVQNWDKLMQDLSQDSEVTLIKNHIFHGKKGLEDFNVEGDRLLYQGRLFLPRTFKWILLLFQEFHSSVIGGHSGVLKTYQRMAAKVYWVGIRKDVAKMVSECEICQRYKYSTMVPEGLLQPLELPDKVWEDVTMDFIDGLPRSKGFTVILLRPYRQRSVAKRRNEKLAPKYFGPYEVLERIRVVAYKLKLPESLTIHPVFHVSQLKKVIGDQIAILTIPSGLNEEMEMLLQPEEVLGTRMDSIGKHEVLIRWKDLPGYEATWEPLENIQQQFLEFYLEDKVILWEGGSDMNHGAKWAKVYKRCSKNHKGATGNN
ncbi:putative mitochondrial protein, partial [Tanacetum coccineum]